MKKKIGLGCLVIVGLVIILAIVGGLAATGTDSSEAGGGQPAAATQAPAAATQAPAAAQPRAAGPLELSGRGTSTTALNLTDGLYTVDIAITENIDDGIPSHVSVEVLAVGGGQALLVNEIGASWSGSVAMRVGSGLLDLQPGRSIVGVGAASGAAWEMSIAGTSGSSAVEFAPSPTASPVKLSGRGTATNTVDLADGLYTVDISITEDIDDGIPSHVSVEIEAVEGGQVLLVNQIGASWSGSVTLRVGSGPLDLQPGSSIVSVDAASGAAWEISIQPQ